MRLRTLSACCVQMNVASLLSNYDYCSYTVRFLARVKSSQWETVWNMPIQLTKANRGNLQYYSYRAHENTNSFLTHQPRIRKRFLHYYYVMCVIQLLYCVVLTGEAKRSDASVLEQAFGISSVCHDYKQTP